MFFHFEDRRLRMEYRQAEFYRGSIDQSFFRVSTSLRFVDS
jgi:hypothetical protein